LENTTETTEKIRRIRILVTEDGVEVDKKFFLAVGEEGALDFGAEAAGSAAVAALAQGLRPASFRRLCQLPCPFLTATSPIIVYILQALSAYTCS
jgi:hypothetical protein